jgi:hypothetical protein
MTFKDNTYEVPFFNIKGEMVWGATAMILSEFIEIIRKIPEFKAS